MQIQAKEKPIIDEIFISPGSFHLEMVFFVLGKTIEESGGPYMLDECKILAKGSINSKSCKRFIRMCEAY